MNTYLKCIILVVHILQQKNIFFELSSVIRRIPIQLIELIIVDFFQLLIFKLNFFPQFIRIQIIDLNVLQIVNDLRPVFPFVHALTFFLAEVPEQRFFQVRRHELFLHVRQHILVVHKFGLYVVEKHVASVVRE